MAISLAIVALLSTNGAHPELFGYQPVDSITSTVDERGEVSWSTSDMIIGRGWRPTTYDEHFIRELFGEPTQVAPKTVAWAFAHRDAPDFGVMLVPRGDGRVTPALWDKGFVDLDHWGNGSSIVEDSSSMWLNALADFQRQVLPTPGR